MEIWKKGARERDGVWGGGEGEKGDFIIISAFSTFPLVYRVIGYEILI